MLDFRFDHITMPLAVQEYELLRKLDRIVEWRYPVNCVSGSCGCGPVGWQQDFHMSLLKADFLLSFYGLEFCLLSAIVPITVVERVGPDGHFL